MSAATELTRAPSAPPVSLPVVSAPAGGTPAHDRPTATNPGAGIDYELFLDCVHCGLCTASCPTYVELGNENDSPRGRIYLMRAVTDGRLGLTTEVRRHLELCLDCRACETACPSGVQYGKLIEPFRIAMEQVEGGSAAKSTDWFHRWVLFGLFPYPRRLRLALLPARIAQFFRLDRAAQSLGLFNLLPARLAQLARMLPPRQKAQPQLPEFLPAIGPRRARVAFFTGCVGDALFRHTNWATARVLQQNGCDVLIPRGQVCCGAIHFHAGSSEPAREMADANARAFNELDVDAVVTNIAGCGAMLKDYGHHWHLHPPFETRRESEGELPSAMAHAGGQSQQAQSQQAQFQQAQFQQAQSQQHARRQLASRVRDVNEFLDSLGLVPPKGEIRVVATYHDACHLNHAQRIREQPRRLLAAIPGLVLKDLPETDLCCGAAGTYNLTEPEMSARLSRRKLANIRSTGASVVVTANAGCLLQIQREARQQGQTLTVVHPMDLLDLSYRGEPLP